MCVCVMHLISFNNIMIITLGHLCLIWFYGNYVIHIPVIVTNTFMTEFASETQPVVHPAQKKIDPVNLGWVRPKGNTEALAAYEGDEFLLMIETWIFYDMFKSHISHS